MRYVATGKGLATAANTNVLSIRSSAAVRVKVEEFHVFAETGVAMVSAALFLTTVADTAGTAVTPQKDDPQLVTATAVVSTLPTGGTLAGVASRRGATAAAIGSGIMWLWPSGDQLTVPAGLSLIFRNDGALGPAIAWTIVWSE